MIVLTEITNKLEELLNQSSVDFSFKGATQGFHLDSIADKKVGKNKIPFFVSLVGGEHNPVPNLKQSTYNIQVVLYYPVRFKDNFYLLNEYLEDTFVGKMVNFGTLTGNALCNVSVSQYGEIVGLDLEEFEKWVEDTYNDPSIFQNTSEGMDAYMSMTFVLYISKLGDTINKFVFGNDINYKLEFSNEEEINRLTVLVQGSTREQYFDRAFGYDIEIQNIKYYAWRQSTNLIYTLEKIPTPQESHLYNNEGILLPDLTIEDVEPTGTYYTKTYEEQCIWTSSGTGASITPLSQQLVGVDSFVKNVANITNYNKSIVVYVRENEFWETFLDKYNNQNEFGNLTLTKTYILGTTTKQYVFNQLILTINENIALGEPISFTLAFGDGEE